MCGGIDRHCRPPRVAIAVSVLIGLALLVNPPSEPSSTTAQREAGEAAHSMAAGQVDEAIQHLTNAVTLDPETNRYWIDRANCYLARGDYQLAFEDFTCGLGILRTREALYARAGVAIKLDKWETVAEDYGALFQFALLEDPASLGLFKFPAAYVDDEIKKHPQAVWLWVARGWKEVRLRHAGRFDRSAACA